MILKAFFDEDQLISDCVMAAPDGTGLEPCGRALFVGAEIDKLAANVAMARNFAGIHYRSDMTAGLRLGEEVAMALLRDWVTCYREEFDGFEFRRFDGTRVRITNGPGGNKH